MIPVSKILFLVAFSLATLGLAAPAEPAANAPRTPGMPEWACDLFAKYNHQAPGCPELDNKGKDKRDEHVDVAKRGAFNDYICKEAEKHLIWLGGCDNIISPDEWRIGWHNQLPIGPIKKRTDAGEDERDEEGNEKRRDGVNRKRDVDVDLICKVTKELKIESVGCPEE